ncbi:hypothetical protein KQX54_013363, partial [Cotesia glomerata]
YADARSFNPEGREHEKCDPIPPETVPETPFSETNRAKYELHQLASLPATGIYKTSSAVQKCGRGRSPGPTKPPKLPSAPDVRTTVASRLRSELHVVREVKRSADIYPPAEEEIESEKEKESDTSESNTDEIVNEFLSEEANEYRESTSCLSESDDMTIRINPDSLKDLIDSTTTPTLDKTIVVPRTFSPSPKSSDGHHAEDVVLAPETPTLVRERDTTEALIESTKHVEIVGSLSEEELPNSIQKIQTKPPSSSESEEPNLGDVQAIQLLTSRDGLTYVNLTSEGLYLWPSKENPGIILNEITNVHITERKWKIISTIDIGGLIHIQTWHSIIPASYLDSTRKCLSFFTKKECALLLRTESLQILERDRQNLVSRLQQLLSETIPITEADIRTRRTPCFGFVGKIAPTFKILRMELMPIPQIIGRETRSMAIRPQKQYLAIDALKDQYYLADEEHQKLSKNRDRPHLRT